MNKKFLGNLIWLAKDTDRELFEQGSYAFFVYSLVTSWAIIQY